MLLNLPLIVKFNKDSFLSETDYWGTDTCKKGFYYMVYNMDKYFLLLPENKSGFIKEISTANSVVITRGNYKGKDDWFEIMFEDNTDNPYMIMLEDEQFTRVSPLKEGWNGKLYIYCGSLNNCPRSFDKVYYRVKQNLPCLQPVE